MTTEELIDRLAAATGPDADLDEALVSHFEMIDGHPTASIDGALVFFKAIFPDTKDRRFSMTIWTGFCPAARISYEQRDAEAEGGWAIGFLNHPFDVRAKTEPLAMCLAVVKATEGRA